MNWFCSHKLDISNSDFFKNCDKIQDFMNLENEGTCVQQHILDVMLRMFSNISKATLTDTSAYFWLKLNCKIIRGLEENQ